MRSSLLLTPLFFLALACSGTGSAIGDGGLLEGGSDGAVELTPDGGTLTPDGGLDAAKPTQPVEGIYFGACLSRLAAGRVDRVFRFYTEVKYTPIAPDGKATLELRLTALELGAGNTAPPTVSKSATVGQTYAIPKASLSPGGVYAGPLGTMIIPGAANPISGREVIIEQATVPGRFTAAKFCSQLTGHVVTPTDIVLEGPSNTCIYLPVKDGDPTPAIQLSDFPATCSLD